jgi:SAM-dependent methyltransferase
MSIEPEITRYYTKGGEQSRLTEAPSLERIRTQILLKRYLPAPPARIMDVGGASGVYAKGLAESGYQVLLIDPVPLHVELASALDGVQARLGDARDLAEPDASTDAVLLLGPLYHLLNREDRLQAFREARRVLRPGGVVLAAAISRYASSFDGFFRGFIDRPGFTSLLTEDQRTGQHRNPQDQPNLFTTAYFHDGAELAQEVTESGLSLDAVLPIEGMLPWVPGITDRLQDPEQLELILTWLESIETDPAMLNAGSHLMAVAHAPQSTKA